MSAYAYVPIAQVPQLQQHYDVATPATWVFERQMSASPADRAHFGGIEVSGPFTPAQIAEITALGGQHFPSAAAFTMWRHQFA